MSKRVSERQRWVEIFLLPEPSSAENAATYARTKHGEARAVLEAFQKVGRVVRVEPAKYGNGIALKARRA